MTISFFGKGSCDVDSFEYKTAFDIASKLARKGHIIASGGYGGVMEAVLKAASKFNVERIGITCSEIKDRKPNKYITQHIVTETYLQRLEKLIKIADGYIVLPGDTGTLLELSAIWALKKRDIIDKPVVCIGEQWQNIIETVGFYSANAISEVCLIQFADDAKSAIDKINKCLKI